MKNGIYFLVLSLLMLGCAQNQQKSNTITPPAMRTSEFITVSNDDTVSQLATTIIPQLEEKGFKIIANIDHSNAATKVGLELRPTRTIIFGNPKGGTLLMQQDQRIGLDLPLKLMMWEDAAGDTQVSYYNATTLTSRYGITEPQAVIAKVNGALAGFTGNTQIEGASVTSITDQLITKKSPHTADETFAKLQEVVTSKGLHTMAVVPHDKAAASVDLELRPTRVLIFGNPKVGTLLMQSNQSIGIDLPLKILVHEDENGAVYVSYFDATFLTNRHGITDKDEVVQKVNAALDGITNAVIAE
ncbi:DUF302 domain-containing protein [uncultured Dokdonia sp.]|uniref:DUF302 domain-containing protein n=1 Tax=uncultured Dokdonia sp. TaxID=575653 RepID=UPI00260E8A95|nr:DUF302 domain-containing protein [uncultured Dokdonia sp.]